MIIARARYLSLLRKHQGPQAQTPKWIKRTPEQMVIYKESEGLAGKKNEERDMRLLMSGFVERVEGGQRLLFLDEIAELTCEMVYGLMG
ncbi:hypothetical protein NC652_041025 [Populus alba x Populus x berolinensis]|nr:hypothetical protein NC652_041025 [Populus alba x Populus x berolinensis]